LGRKLAEREETLARVQRDRDDLSSALDEYRRAVDRRRAAEESLVEFYREVLHAQRAAPGETPPRRWLH
jgi:hypothetical protein